MAQIKKIDRPVKMQFQIPASIHDKVHQQLYSEIEGRVPFGALSKLVENLFTDWLRTRGVLD